MEADVGFEVVDETDEVSKHTVLRLQMEADVGFEVVDRTDEVS
ncbi:Uncharacterised protein [Streptococcus pneumoniae]|nr:Uncharacterised protein [Streptococcus pneumoniae]